MASKWYEMTGGKVGAQGKYRTNRAAGMSRRPCRQLCYFR